MWSGLPLPVDPQCHTCITAHPQVVAHGKYLSTGEREGGRGGREGGRERGREGVRERGRKGVREGGKSYKRMKIRLNKMTNKYNIQEIHKINKLCDEKHG